MSQESVWSSSSALSYSHTLPNDFTFFFQTLTKKRQAVLELKRSQLVEGWMETTLPALAQREREGWKDRGDGSCFVCLIIVPIAIMFDQIC